MVVFEHVSSHASRQPQNLSRFQEFVMVLIKLRFNVSLKDLAYRTKCHFDITVHIYYHFLLTSAVCTKEIQCCNGKCNVYPVS